MSFDERRQEMPVERLGNIDDQIAELQRLIKKLDTAEVNLNEYLVTHADEASTMFGRQRAAQIRADKAVLEAQLKMLIKRKARGPIPHTKTWAASKQASPVGSHWAISLPFIILLIIILAVLAQRLL